MNTTITIVLPADESAWDLADVREFLNVCERTLFDLRKDPTFPAPRFGGQKPRWSPLAIRSWLAGFDLTALATTAPAVKSPRTGGRRTKAAHHVD